MTITRGRPKTRSINRADVARHATQLRIYILDNDIKNFEERISIVHNEGGDELLDAVINHNFLNEPQDIFTAMQAATLTTIATGETEIFIRLIQLGAETAWDTSPYSTVDPRGIGRFVPGPNKPIYGHLQYSGRAVSGNSVYECFKNAFISESLAKKLDKAFLDASVETLSDQIDDVLHIHIPADVTALIREFTGREMSDALLFNRNLVGWMRNMHDQAIFESFSAQYRTENPHCDEQGYGPGALVVYKPKDL